MRAPKNIEGAARARIAGSTPQIKNTLERAAEGNPLGAEPDSARLRARLQRKAMLTPAESVAMAAGIRAMTAIGAVTRGESVPKENKPEQVWGSTIDFVGVAFLERGVRVARSVARIAYRDGRPLGSGFLVSPRLFLTNNHVIASAAEARQLVVEFDYELDAADNPRDLTRFYLDPGAFFLTDERDDLDFTLIAVGDRERGSLDLATFGYTRLSSAGDKHVLGEFANVIQHPDGRYKEVVLRENRLVSRLDTVLHYMADTEPGSSGSPVFNNEWQVVALHHWGGPWRQKNDGSGKRVPTEVNEGIRTSAIVKRLVQRSASLDTARKMLLEQVIRAEESSHPEEPARAPVASADSRTATVEADGRVTWRIPLELSVRLPVRELTPAPAPDPRATTIAPGSGVLAADGEMTPERRIEPDPDYANRRGYKADFIQGCSIPLPKLAKSQEKAAAKNLEAEGSANPFELKYEHFSVVMNRVRRLAFFTACNIDGRNAKNVDRSTGAITLRKPGESEEALSEAAEASETWFRDERIGANAACNQQLYSNQTVPGFKKGTSAWMNRMFQRGHLVRRLDPLWGSDKSVRKAEADTFHFTNCTPQVGFFNMGSAPKSAPGGGELWRALEDYVLDNAVDEQKRVCVFTGPVFDDHKDPLWRTHVVPGFKVPLRFWKIVAWVENGTLNAVAMVADQEPVIKVMPEGLEPEDGERFVDTTKVEDFLTTVAKLEDLTGLDFGKALREADVNAGAEGLAGEFHRITRFEQIPLARGARPEGKDHRMANRLAFTPPRRSTNGRLKATSRK